MPKHPRKGTKKPVARHATPEEVLSKHPVTKTLARLKNADQILSKRHAELRSWRVLSWELGGVNKGTLSEVAAGKRAPSKRLIAKINNVYHAHIIAPQRIDIIPLSCGHAPLRKSCPICTPKKYAPHPVMRLSRLKAILNSPYRDS